MTIPFVNSLLARLQRRPMTVGLVIAALVVLWSAWIAYTYIVTPVPTEADIAGQILRLDDAKLQRLTGQIEQYRSVPTPPTLSGNPVTTPN